MVKELLNQYANIEEKDKYGCTPLIEGISLNFLKVVKELLDKCASVKHVTFIDSQNAS